MKNKIISFFTLSIAFFLLSGCVSQFMTVKESPSAPDLAKYKNIYIGWLDLNEENWKT